MSYDPGPKKRKIPVGRQSGTCIPPKLKDGSPNPHFEKYLRGGPSIASTFDQYFPRIADSNDQFELYKSSKLYSEE
jgi:hypothetical protein